MEAGMKRETKTELENVLEAISEIMDELEELAEDDESCASVANAVIDKLSEACDLLEDDE